MHSPDLLRREVQPIIVFMGRNRHQHDVPAGYFFPWADSPERGARLFVCDGERARLDTPAGICKERDLYTETQHADEERFWSESESDWPPRIRRIGSERKVIAEDGLSILRFATELHARNRAYENTTELERLALMQPMIWGLRARDVLGVDGPTVPHDQRDERFAVVAGREWALLVAETAPVFTSDNPVLRIGLADDRSQRAAMYALPLTPTQWAFLYDTTRVVLVGDGMLTLGDMQALALWTLRNARTMIVSDREIHDEARSAIKEDLARFHARGRIEDGRADSFVVTPPPLSCFRRASGEPFNWEPTTQAA